MITGRSTWVFSLLLALAVAVLAAAEYRAAARTFGRVGCQLTVQIAEFGGQAPDPAACGQAR